MAISTPNPEILPQNPFTGLDDELEARWRDMSPAEWLPFLEAEAHYLIACGRDEDRVWKGFELSSRNAVTSPSRGFYRVESGSRAYALDQTWRCNCLDQTHRHVTCKHSFAAIILSRAMNRFAAIYQKENKVNEPEHEYGEWDRPWPGGDDESTIPEHPQWIIEAAAHFGCHPAEVLSRLAALKHGPHNGSAPTPDSRATPSHTEAPYSANIKAISPEGFEVMITMRRGTGEERAFFSDLNKLQAWLKRNEYRSTGRSSQPAGDASGEPEFKPCPIHSVNMKRRKGRNGFFYSHQLADESWCSGKEK